MRDGAVLARHRLGRDQRVHDRLLGRLDRRVEERRRSTRSRASSRRLGALGRDRPRLPVAKAMKMSPLAVLAGAADPRDAEPGALREPVALVGQERRVGGDDDDDRAARRAARPSPATGIRSAGIASPDRHAVDREPLARAVVRLHEHADRVAAVLGRRARRDAVPMPPLNPWQIIPVPPPTLPSATGPVARRVDRREDVLRAARAGR